MEEARLPFVVVDVAPHVGAWIEIFSKPASSPQRNVAPHVGAWIEIAPSATIMSSTLVAPHVGAWIEIDGDRYVQILSIGRTPRGCVD